MTKIELPIDDSEISTRRLKLHAPFVRSTREETARRRSRSANIQNTGPDADYSNNDIENNPEAKILTRVTPAEIQKAREEMLEEARRALAAETTPPAEKSE